jgi:hypothetical protein
MSDYKPGTVAMVTYNGQRHKAMRTEFGQQSTSPDGCWYILGWGGGYNETKVTDITPLVCIEATREDADQLTLILRGDVPSSSNGPDYDPPRTKVVRRIRDAILEQTPEPEPPKRWTVDEGIGEYWLGDNGRPTGVGSTSKEHAQRIADALNAAEATS